MLVFGESLAYQNVELIRSCITASKRFVLNLVIQFCGSCLV
ncbi:hypothetical protein HanRHA438_Chr13g0614271 [Helianthus annuus]|uniref:Uncharacterized protein n=1 Tax=Helianthus annuus TaxID=4232 RepID=A0A9K3HD69_HELAN|nr:hypothetical protein HanXRQr2_Chr13g0603731 [Helianthus annuus]KAJ0478001.1 hypothetical protein HanHA300_Chr13g0495241 [Helianthus annuus]KAJ0498859.1 hypothetical protein HanHA89_Chr13g0527701 [Helianthus annuus]KAJ0664873.1 hypothetical protein HanLR1_Chr13g0497721 [Helianthus annuus]KAJ0672303.1 hypothetical protein HanOQP8_Chr13g0495781 [Helianthus annuus]